MNVMPILSDLGELSAVLSEVAFGEVGSLGQGESRR